MKIAFLVHEFPPQIGGISTRAYRISKGLSERGHEINVYTSANPKAPHIEKIDGIKVERYNLLNPYIARLIKAPITIMPGLFKLFGKREIRKADIVQSFSFLMFVSLVAASLKLVQKKVFVLNPLFIPYHAARTYFLEWSVIPYRLTLGKAIIQCADLLVTETSSERRELIRLGVPSEKTEVVPNAINPDDFRSLPDPSIFRKQHRIDADDKIVLFVGRPVLWKGVDHVMYAMQNVLKELREAKLVIVGPRLRRMDKLLRSVSFDARDCTVLTGPLTGESVRLAYSAADVFVLPSKVETFSMVALEAAAAGLPIVSTRTGVAPDIINNGKNGLFVEYGKVNQISEAITKVLLTDDFKRKAEEKRNFIWENYNVKTEIDQYEKIYMRLTRTTSMLED